MALNPLTRRVLTVVTLTAAAVVGLGAVVGTVWYLILLVMPRW